MTHAAFEHKGPVYLRLTGGMRAPIVYKEDFELVPGKANTLLEGEDIAIIATGSMVHTSLTVAGHLADQGVQATVIDMHTIKPLDVATLQQHLDKKLLVTVEEHSVTGGLGSAVAEFLAGEECRPKLMIAGIPQGYPHAGDYAWMLEQSGLTAAQLTAQILGAL
jgi:transketolase